MAERRFFDTTVLVYAHDASEPEKRKVTRELLSTHLANQSAVLSTQVLQEYFVAAMRIGLSAELAQRHVFARAQVAFDSTFSSRMSRPFVADNHLPRSSGAIRRQNPLTTHIRESMSDVLVDVVAKRSRDPNNCGCSRSGCTSRSRANGSAPCAGRAAMCWSVA